MNEWVQKVLESKKQMRNRLAEASFSEKVKVLEKLRDRSLLLAKNRLRFSQQPPR